MSRTIIKPIRKTRLGAMSIPAEDIVSGHPVARGVVLATSKDGRCCAGIWSCTPGVFDWVYDGDETCTILEGEAVIKIKGGRSKRLRAGDFVNFPKGLKTRWTVKKRILKTFTLYEPR